MAGLLVRVLVDNTTLTDRYFTGEPGFSCYIECRNKRILFDTGYSDAVIRNAARMGINLLNLDFIVLSHGHIDHTGGLVHILRTFMEAAIEEHECKKPVVIAHPHCYFPRPLPLVGDIGAPVDEATIQRQCPVTTSKKPLWLTPDLVYLGEIDRLMNIIPDRTRKRTIITPEGPEADRLLDDTALAYLSGQGLVIITGCSHSGIPNIIAQARKVCAEQRIRDVIGGLHLRESDKVTLNETIEFLKTVNPAALHPCHCTSLAAKVALSGIAPVGEVGVGSVFEY